MGNSEYIIYNVSDCGNTLSVRVIDDLLEEMQDCDGYAERENLLYDAAYEPHYTYTTADSFGDNLSEAPCFLEFLDRLDNGDCEAVGDWYYYDEYMINDFTEKLAKGETVLFTKAT